MASAYDCLLASLDEISGQAVGGLVDLAESVCPALSEYLSWELMDPTLQFVIEEDVLPANIATVFTALPDVMGDWFGSTQATVLELSQLHAAHAA